MRSPRLKEALWIIFAVLLCAHFCLSYFELSPSFLNLTSYEHGFERQPYQARILPALVLLEADRIHVIVQVAGHMPAELREPHRLELFLLCFVAMLAAVAATRASLHTLTADAIFSRWASLLVVFLAYFNFQLVVGPNFLLPYDIPALAFFCIGVWATVTQRYWFYYLFFLFAAVNRETICLLTIFFLAWEWQRNGTTARAVRLRRLALHALVQAAIWFAIRHYLNHRFAGNPSDDLGILHRLTYNVRELFNPLQWPVLLSVFGFSLPFIVACRRYILPVAFRRATFLVLGISLVAMMFYGVIIEIRIFGELLSVASIALALILYHRFYRPSAAAAAGL